MNQVSEKFDKFKNEIKELIEHDEYSRILDCIDSYKKSFTENSESHLTRFGKNLKEQKDIFQKFTDLSPAGISVLRLDKYFYVNKAWCILTGYSEEESQKMTPADIIHPDMQEMVIKRAKDRLDGKDVPERYEIKLITKNKESVWVDISFAVISFKGVTATLTIMNDITEMKEAQLALKQSEEKYRSLIENLKQEYFFYRHDTKGYITYVSSSIEFVLGYSKDQFLMHYSDFFTNSPINEVAVQKAELALSGIQQLPYEVEVYDIQKNIHILEVSENPVVDSEGNVKVVEGIAHDITEQKKAKDIITSQLEEIKLQNEEIKSINEEIKAVNDDLEDRIEEINKLNEELKISESKFRALVKNIPGAVYQCLDNKDWTMLYISEEIELLTGYPACDFIHNKVRSFASIIHPDDREYVNENTIEEDKSNTTYSIEYRIIHANGNIVWVSERGQKTRIDEDDTEYLNGVILDITKQKKIDQELKESRELYQRLVNNQGEAIVIVDNNNEFVFVNPAAVEVFGVGEGNLIGRNVKEFLTDEYLEIVNKQTETRTLGKKSTYELEILRPDQKKRYLLVTASPEYNKENKVTGAFAIFRDITGRRLAEKALLESEKELRKSNAQKDRFFSLLAHDLRSPVGNFLQISELLKLQYKELSKDQIHDFFDNLYKLADKTFKLLDNLLMWSRSQLGTLEINKQEIDLYQIVEEVAYLFEENFKAKNLTIENKLTENLKVKADYNIIQTLIRNLLSNAIKFSYNEGVIEIDSKLQIDHSKDTEYYIISVKDSGVGIPQDKIELIFNMDEEYTTPGTAKEKGTGLGLVLCKDLIEKSGERMWVGSEEGVGTTFYFTLER